MSRKCSIHPKCHLRTEPFLKMSFCFWISYITVCRTLDCFTYFLSRYKRPDYGPSKAIHGPKTCEYITAYCKKNYKNVLKWDFEGWALWWIQGFVYAFGKQAVLSCAQGEMQCGQGLPCYFWLLLVVLMTQQVLRQTMQVASWAGEDEEMGFSLPLSSSPEQE